MRLGYSLSCLSLLAITFSSDIPNKLLQHHSFSSGISFHGLSKSEIAKDGLKIITSLQSYDQVPTGLFDNYSSVSLEAWTSRGSNSCDAHMLIFGNFSSTVASSIAISRYCNTETPTMTWYESNGFHCPGNCHETISNCKFDEQVKMHVVFTLSQGDFGRLYVDGIMAGLTPTIIPSVFYLSAFRLCNALTPETAVNDSLTELRVWGGILSSSDIHEHFIHGPTPGSIRGLQSGLPSCSSCAAGTYSSAYNLSSCDLCPAGHYSNIGASYCSLCSSGTYSTAGASSCTLISALSTVDVLSGAAQASLLTAFACYQTTSQYTGPTFRFRRSSDSAVADFYADFAGSLTMQFGGGGTSLSKWLSGSTAYVAVWYDQSGQGYHAAQAVVSNQPIYDSVKQCVNFETSAYLVMNSKSLPAGNGPYSFVLKHGEVLDSYGVFFGVGSILDGGCVSLRVNGGTQYDEFWWNSDFNFGTYSPWNAVSETYDQSHRRGYVSGQLQATQASSNRSLIPGAAFLGKALYNSYLNGEIKYVFFFNGLLSSSDRETLERGALNCPAGQYFNTTLGCRPRQSAVTLLHRYSFNNQTASDSVGGSAFDGSLQAGAFIAGGQVQFTTTGPYMSLPSTVFGTHDSITIEAWVSTGVNTGWARILQFGSTSADANSVSVMRDDRYGVLRTQYVTSSSYFYDKESSVVFNSQQHLHVAVTVSSGLFGAVSMYLNGTLVASTGIGTVPTLPVPSFFYIGKSLVSTDTGSILSVDEFRIWGGDLPASQIASCHKGGPNPDWLSCPPGAYFDGQSTICKLCPSNTISTAKGSFGCTHCPSGSFSSSGSSSCFSCPAGYKGSSTGCSTCSAGTYSSSGVQCSSCPAGTYSLSTASACSSCLSGTYSAKNGSASCVNCPAGKYSDSRSTGCQSCPAGYISGETAPNCTVCAAGSYASTSLGATACVRCPAGSYSVSQASTMCYSCPAGTYSATVGATSCSTCPVGTFSPTPMSTSCVASPLGSYSSYAGVQFCTYSGATASLPCPSGKYSSTLASSTCVSCPTGKYSSAVGSTAASACSACSIGKYSNVVGATSASTCSTCAAGKYAPTNQTATCVQCQPGSFSATNGSASCALCAAGKYVATLGSTVCSDCEANSYSAVSGATLCSSCPTGYQSTSSGATACVVIGYAATQGAKIFGLTYSESVGIIVALILFIISAFLGMFWCIRKSSNAKIDPYFDLLMYKDPIARACRNGDLISLQALLSTATDDVTFAVSSGTITLLHIALQYEQLEIARFLFQRGINPAHWDLQNHHGDTFIDVGFKSTRADVIKLLLEFDLPYELLFPHAPVDDHGSWFRLLDPSQNVDSSTRVAVVTAILETCDIRLINKLTMAKDKKGRQALNIVDDTIKQVFNSFLFFCGRFELMMDEAAVHVSDTSIVLKAVDHRVDLEYSRFFDDLLSKEGSKLVDLVSKKGTRQKGVNKAACMAFALSRAIDAHVGAQKHLSVIEAELNNALNAVDANANSFIEKDEFIVFCKRVLGEYKRVVLKFMLNEDQYEKEASVRIQCSLDPQFIMGILDGPSPAEFRAGVEKMALKVNGKTLSDYKYGIVMPQADRSLHGIIFSERPEVDQVRQYVKEVVQSLGHLHSKGVGHFDVKAMNFLRNDGHILITDMDAATFVQGGNFAGGKFSSGVLPPEMFYKFKSRQEKDQYVSYWSHVDPNSALWKKIRPMDVIEDGRDEASYVVRTFQSSDVRKDIDETVPFLPYDLVPASTAIDFWSLGVLMFQLLTGQNWVSVNRDDDLAGAEEMERAATWTDAAVSTRLTKFKLTINDTSAFDLLEQLLSVNPEERPKSMADVLFHPFFDPHGAAHEPEATPFITLAKSSALSPLDDVEVIRVNKWRFNKINAQLGRPRSEWAEEDAASPDDLFALTHYIIASKVNKVPALNDTVKADLSRMVSDELSRYATVNTSIFDNLVAKVEREELQAFEAAFEVVARAVKKSTPLKPKQLTGDAIDLFYSAATARNRYQNFVDHLSKMAGVQSKCAPLKNFLRVCEKVILDYESDMSRVTDLVRGKMFCDNMVDMSRVLRALLALDRSLEHVQLPGMKVILPPLSSETIDIRVVSAKQRLAKLGDCLFNVSISLPDGGWHVCELQVALKKVEVAREELGGHDSYNWVRSVRSYLEAAQNFGDAFRTVGYQRELSYRRAFLKYDSKGSQQQQQQQQHRDDSTVLGHTSQIRRQAPTISPRPDLMNSSWVSPPTTKLDDIKEHLSS